MKQNNFKVIGLTGSIGSGKSTVSGILKSLNIKVIDADKVSRVAAEDATVLLRLKEEFGDNIVDEYGHLKRKELGSIVFRSKEKLNTLNSIIHPVMREIILNEIKLLKLTEKICVLDAAILIESGFVDMVNEVVLVLASEEKIITRVQKRDGYNKEYIKKILDTQMDINEKKKYCSYIINNDKGINELYNEVIKMLVALDMEAVDA
ncbi:MAG: dephospho-CoA kinase [Clostridium sp.]|uniref:dephospho-CoA kinase n=1 Tax=Clostridium sp. TaxID=1506 RepID=UPI002FCCB33B